MRDSYEHQYANIMRDIYRNGHPTDDRTGVGTKALFNMSMDLRLYSPLDRVSVMPLLHFKSVHVKSVIHELLWFISGSTNVGYLQDNGVSIWNEWADENGELGPVYGHQWRKGKDQLQTVIDNIKTNPYSRRHLVSAWNVDELADMKLPPCHYAFQFHCYEYDKVDCLDMTVNMRSADWFLGVPFNAASYALLAHMVGTITGRRASRMTLNFGNAHLYNNHTAQAESYLYRYTNKDVRDEGLGEYEVKMVGGLDTLEKVEKKLFTIDDFRAENIEIMHYKPMAAVKAPIAV